MDLNFLKNIVDYYPLLFIFAFLIIVVFVNIRNPGRKHARNRENKCVANIDSLMRNQNAGIPTACIVDSLKSDNVEFRGVEDR